MKTKLIGALLAFVVMAPGSSFATLLGDTINATAFNSSASTFDRFSDTLNGFDTAVVADPDIEFSTGPIFIGAPFSSDFTANFSDSSMELRLSVGEFTGSAAVTFSSFRFFDLHWVGSPNARILDVALVSNTFETCPRFSNCTTGGTIPVIPQVTFGDHEFSVVFPRIGMGSNVARSYEMVANFNITAEHAVVPEPGTLALFGLGLAGLGMARRKRAT